MVDRVRRGVGRGSSRSREVVGPSITVLVTLILCGALIPSNQAALADGFGTLESDGVGRYRPQFTESSGSNVVSNIDSVTSPALSPDGERIAYSGSIGDESLGRYGIYVAGIDGSGATQVTPGSFAEFDPAWSPDGQFIVFSQNVAGSIVASNCCRIARVNLSTGVITAVTDSNGTLRPSYSPDGSLITFDTLDGVWTMPASGGPTTLRASTGYDTSFSPDGRSLVYLVSSGSTHSIRELNLSSGAIQILYSTSRRMEDPVWQNGRIYFLEYSGDGYDGRSGVQVRSVGFLSPSPRVERSLPGRHVGFSVFNNDEMFFYRDDGLFRFYHVRADGSLPEPLLAGDGYTTGWDAITAVDVNSTPG